MNGHAALRAALKSCLERSLTFAAFRTPGSSVELWAQRTPEVETVEGDLMWELNEVFVIAPFDLDPRRVPFIRSDVEMLFGDIGPDLELLGGCIGAPAPSFRAPASTERSAFISNVEAARNACRSGDLNKVVLSRVTHEAIEREALIDLFLQVLNDQPNALVAIAQTPEHGLWLGASPERLVWEEEDHVRVDALAGSRANGNEQPWPEKEQYEQQLVADSVLGTLTSLGLENISMTKTTTVNAGTLDHLYTCFEADLGTRSLSDVVLALHPTPAICGTPTDKARAFIQQHETHARDLYCGFWGPWNPDGRTELFVNIRCLRASSEGATLYVGAGITKDSDPQLEWEETERKASTWTAPIKALK